MVTVLFQTESHFPVDRKKIKAAVTAYLGQRVESDVEVSISIVGDRQIHELNKTYRKKDYPTDVLSFPHNDPSQPNPIPFVDPPDNLIRLGDIVVSYPQARSEAMEKDTLVDDEIVVLILHGIDHLLGIHHPE
jgi:probable rRNA maturation factor